MVGEFDGDTGRLVAAVSTPAGSIPVGPAVAAGSDKEPGLFIFFFETFGGF